MPADMQAVLATLLEKSGLPAFVSSSPLYLTEDTVKSLACKSPYSRLQPLLTKYVELAASSVKKAQEPFCGQGDIVPKDLIQVAHSLDLVENCLRKGSMLLNHALRRPKALLEMVPGITIMVDGILEQIASFRFYIAEQRAKYPYPRKLRGDIKKRLADLLEKLAEFQTRWPAEKLISTTTIVE